MSLYDLRSAAGDTPKSCFFSYFYLSGRAEGMEGLFAEWIFS